MRSWKLESTHNAAVDDMSGWMSNPTGLGREYNNFSKKSKLGVHRVIAPTFCLHSY
jgi:hypothetical protein